MTILVTGGAGYIGSHVVKLLNSLDRNVVVIDNLYNGFKASIGANKFVEGDISDEDLVIDVCRTFNVERAIHFAALKSVGESMDQPHRYYEWNVNGTVKLTRALIESGVKKLVFSSSASVYGTPETMPMTEQTPRNPESVYAATKAVMEEFFSFCRPLGLETVCLRYFNAAGASMDCSIGEDWSTTHNLIPRLMKAMLTGSETLQLFGTDYPTPDGTCVRDYIHVEDLARAHVRALDFLDSDRGSLTVNVGTGRGHSVREVIDMAEKVSGLKVPITQVGRRPGDPPAIYADPSFAKRQLDWSAELNLEDIVQSSYRWYVANPNGYRLVD
jgi:UDP-glucose-4-epimerase GalE